MHLCMLVIDGEEESYSQRGFQLALVIRGMALSVESKNHVKSLAGWFGEYR